LKYGLFDDPANEPAGFKTLRRRSRLGRYNRWVWERIRPYVGQRVLEVGAGSGTMTRFLYGRELIVATDRETPYLDRLRNRFRRKPGIIIEKLDLDTDDNLDLARYGFDTVTCINVLEHTADDVAALKRVHQLLQPGGRVVVFVPAGHDLFGSLDKGVGHQRRYDRDELVEKLKSAGFEIEDVGYQNRIAKLAWYFNSKVFGRRGLPSMQSNVFDRMVPLLKSMEGAHPSTGLSLIAIGRKPAAASGAAKPTAVEASGALV
ncbi:MAG: methyltransferase, partial [Acidobacteria bacterium]|nr:methyltransferase [Acidobacteriota bacterium]